MKRVLFVDDEVKILDGLRRSLHGDRTRWEMTFVTSGEAAVEAIESGPFDVVISDMKMPGMDGATLLGIIRARYPNTARIVLSGYTESALAARAASVAHRFLAKPCNIAELQSTIERVCALRELVDSPEIRKIVGSIGELPSLSSTYTELTKALEDPNTSITQVSAIIEQDVAMSAKVLQLTNSAFFGLAQQVTNLSSAVSYLGMQTIKNLVLASEAFRVFVPERCIPLSFCDSIQRHSLATATIAGALPVDRKQREITVLAALLHDIGRLFLATAMPEQFCSTASVSASRKCLPSEAEEEILGTSHAEMGAYLLGLWGIPDIAVEAIAHHHRPTRISHTGFDCALAVFVADVLAHQLNPDAKGSVELGEADRKSLEELGVLERMDEFRELALNALASSRKAAQEDARPVRSTH